MRLKLELHGRAEDIVVHLHQALLVTVGVQVLDGVFDGVQTLVLGLLQVELGGQECPESSVEAGVVSQVTALLEKGTQFRMNE